MPKIVSYELLFAFTSMCRRVSCVPYQGSELFPLCCTIPFLFFHAYIDTKKERKKIRFLVLQFHLLVSWARCKDSSLKISFSVNVFRSMNLGLVVLSQEPTRKDLNPQSLQCCVDSASDSNNTSIKASITASSCPYTAVKCLNEKITFNSSCYEGHIPCIMSINPYPTAFPYGNGMVLHFYQQQESSTTKTVHKVINKGLKAYI